MKDCTRSTKESGGTRIVSRRIYRSAGLAAALLGLACVSGMAGCSLFEEARVRSPYSDREVTEAELAREHADKLRQLELEDKAEQKRIDNEAAKARREFDLAVGTIDLGQQQQLLELRARFDERADEIAGLRAKQERERGYEAAIIADKLASGTEALRAARERQDMIGGLITQVSDSPTTKTLVGMIPGVGSALVGLLGIASAATSAAKRRRDVLAAQAATMAARDAAWDEAQAAKEREVAVRDAHYDQGAQQASVASMLAMLAQLPALQQAKPPQADVTNHAPAGA